MNIQEANITQMLWKPPLIRLTYIAHPTVDGGLPTPCFIDPQQISVIRRTDTNVRDATDETTIYGPSTLVMISSSLYVHVMESPDTVAMLRDKALGLEQKEEPHAYVTPIK